MYSLLVTRIVWQHVLYLVWVYCACNPESFPLEVADGAVCWSAEVTDSITTAGRVTLQHWMQRKTSRPDGWVMAFNSGQIYNHFPKCVFSFSVPLFRAIHVLTHDPLMWCSFIIPTTDDMFSFDYDIGMDEHKLCLVDSDFSGIMCYSSMWPTACDSLWAVEDRPVCWTSPLQLGLLSAAGTFNESVSRYWAKVLIPLAIRGLLLGKLDKLLIH